MKARWLAKLLYRYFKDIESHRPPDLKIGGDDANPYMKRWWVWRRNKWFNCYLHNMLHDDDDILHDHPWISFSIVLHAPALYENYQEYLYDTFGCLVATRKSKEPRRIVTGQLIVRNAEEPHQLIVKEPAWTLFFTGPKIRDWGFHCPKGWVSWKQYLDPDFDPAKGGVSKIGQGRGCGEMS